MRVAFRWIMERRGCFRCSFEQVVDYVAAVPNFVAFTFNCNIICNHHFPKLSYPRSRNTKITISFQQVSFIPLRMRPLNPLYLLKI